MIVRRRCASGRVRSREESNIIISTFPLFNARYLALLASSWLLKKWDQKIFVIFCGCIHTMLWSSGWKVHFTRAKSMHLHAVGDVQREVAGCIENLTIGSAKRGISVITTFSEHSCFHWISGSQSAGLAFVWTRIPWLVMLDTGQMIINVMFKKES